MPRALVALFALALLSPPCHAGPLLDQVLTPSVVIRTKDGSGTGTCIRHQGETLILTAAHVVESCRSTRTVLRRKDGIMVPEKVTTWASCTITNRHGPVHGTSTTTRKAEVVLYDETLDLALLEPKDARGLVAAGVASACVDLDLGEDTWYCGSGSGLPWNLQKTVVNQDDDDWTTVNGGGWYGHSGAGLFVRREKRYVLVGVVVRLQNTDNPRSPVRCVTRARLADFLGKGVSCVP